jgi:hypothetical protein
MNKRIRTYTTELNQQLSLVLIRRTGSSKFSTILLCLWPRWVSERYPAEPRINGLSLLRRTRPRPKGNLQLNMPLPWRIGNAEDD